MSFAMTIEDAISLHQCLSKISDTINNGDHGYLNVSFDDIIIEYNIKDFGDIEILSVSFGQLKSEKSKDLIQDYFDNYQ